MAQVTCSKFGLLVHGFIRNQEKVLSLSMSIPPEICNLIVQFYPKRMKFKTFSCGHFNLLNDGYEIQGTGINCYGYLIYPETLNPDGYQKGVHYWSVKLLGDPTVQRYCYHSIGVVSEQHFQLISSKQNEWPTKWLGNKAISTSFHRGDDHTYYWNYQDTMTVKLDCDKATVEYFKNEESIKSEDIDGTKAHFFVMTSCALKDNWFQVVETPESLLSKAAEMDAE